MDTVIFQLDGTSRQYLNPDISQRIDSSHNALSFIGHPTRQIWIPQISFFGGTSRKESTLRIHNFYKLWRWTHEGKLGTFRLPWLQESLPISMFEWPPLFSSEERRQCTLSIIEIFPNSAEFARIKWSSLWNNLAKESWKNLNCIKIEMIRKISRLSWTTLYN